MKNTRAEALMAAYLSGNISPTEKAELMAWVSDSPDGQKFFDNAVTLWSITDQQTYPDFGAGKAQAKNQLNNRLDALTDTPTATVRTLQPRRTRWLSMAAAVALLLTAGWWLLRDTTPSNQLLASTATDEQTELILPDGTQVWLNETTQLSYETTNGERRVTLTGEAYFDVATDSVRPFRIYTEQAITTVLGTAFNIRAYPEEEQIEVSVTEGKVALEQRDIEAASTVTEARIELLPGDRGIYEKLSQTLKNETKQAKNSTAWRDGQLDFDGVALEDIIVTLERYYGVNFQFATASIRRCESVFPVLSDPSLEMVLTVIKETSALTITETPDGTYLIDGPPCN